MGQKGEGGGVVGLSTHSVIDVGLGPHGVVFLVYHLGAAQHVEVLHHVLLHVRQGGDLGEVPWSRGGGRDGQTDRETGHMERQIDRGQVYGWKDG